jgi:curved DNA-binding protein CbpA
VQNRKRDATLNQIVDYYEVLQVSRTADGETIRRVYRLLALRFHPDNGLTGDVERFRSIREAYSILGDPDRRVAYDATLSGPRPVRVDAPVGYVAPVSGDFEFEQAARISVLEALYMQRRLEPGNAALYDGELEKKLGVAPDRLEFTIWYLREKGLVRRAAESSRLAITAEGVDFLENHEGGDAPRLLNAANREPDSL